MSTAKIYKKLHKWPGLIISFLLLYYAVTGILMNHREWIARWDINREILPKEFRYTNWNNAAVKGNLIIDNDSILIYGNIGIWATDSMFQRYHSLNQGFPKGSDHRKVFDVHRTQDGHLYAATQFGLYAYDQKLSRWHKFDLPVGIKRFTAIESIGDTLYTINRSYLFTGISNGVSTKFTKTQLQAPEGYKNQVSLFKTIWQIHSGEIFGLPGKLFVDALGLLTVFLSLTGIIYFFFPNWIKKRKRAKKPVAQQVKINRWSLKWHNKTGEWTFILLIILYFTGMFLRPPLLIAIANAKLRPLPFSHLDQPNPWYDKLRDLKYDGQSGILLLSTSEGMFALEPGSTKPKKFRVQPPISVMGINVLEPYGKGVYLIGSFSGLFLWHPAKPEIYNYTLRSVYQGSSGGRPVGDFKITGFIQDTKGNEYMVDYDKGIIALYHPEVFPTMPPNVLKESRMPLWNLSLEIHTGRFFRFMLGNFYILLVPLSSLVAVMVVISGYLLWRKRFRKKRRN